MLIAPAAAQLGLFRSRSAVDHVWLRSASGAGLDGPLLQHAQIVDGVIVDAVGSPFAHRWSVSPWHKCALAHDFEMATRPFAAEAHELRLRPWAQLRARLRQKA